MVEGNWSKPSLKAFDQIPTIRQIDNWPTDSPASRLMGTKPFDRYSYGPWARVATEYGPIFRRELPPEFHDSFGEWVVYMVGPEANKFVTQTHREYFSHDGGWSPIMGPLLERGLLNTDDPEHARDRHLMNPAFAIGYMTKYVPVMQEVIEGRTTEWINRGEVDLDVEARKITFDIAAQALAGFRADADRDRMRHLFEELLRGGHGKPDLTEAQWIERVRPLRQELDAMLLREIARRRRQPTDDILGMLITARDERGEAFTDQQLLGQVHILLVAGHETTTTMAAWLLYLLFTHPAYLERVNAELDTALRETGGNITIDVLKRAKVLGNAVTETGRLRSPSGVVPRSVVKDLEFCGYQIPHGTYVLLCLYACHQMPSVFGNPEIFDPDRFAYPREEDKRTPYALAIFGGGPRVCIGINFAQIELKVLATVVLRRCVLEPVEGHSPVHGYFGESAVIVNGMPVQVKRRQI